MIDTMLALERSEADLSYIARLAMLGELTASIVHELNQPLAAIAINGEAGLRWLERSSPAVDEARANLVDMVRGARRAGEIIRRFRNLFWSGNVETEELDLNSVIKEAVLLIEPEARNKKVGLKLDLAGQPLRVMGDGVQVQQVLVNLFLNAIQAMHAVHDRPRQLMIRSQHDFDQVVVAVQDNGVGFGNSTVERLFDPFFTTRPDGVGIGLSLCRLIVEAHGGRIWGTPNDGHGATFQFALPLVR